MSAQVALSLGLHAQGRPPLGQLLLQVAGLIAGTAGLATGMLGAAEAYGKAAASLAPLLAERQLRADVEIAIRDPQGLRDRNRGFWTAYARAGYGVSAFLAVFLVLGALLADQGYLVYVAALTLGVLVCGSAVAGAGISSLRALARAHREVAASVTVAEAQPLAAPEPPAAVPTRKWAIRRAPASPVLRDLETRRGRQPRRR
jgi:hypothetical protein